MEKDYTGDSDIKTSPASKWLSQLLNTSTLYHDSLAKRRIAYLVDTGQWSKFANATYADYAIGGPPIELYAASYNTTHTKKIAYRFDSADDQDGYDIYWNGEELDFRCKRYRFIGRTVLHS